MTEFKFELQSNDYPDFLIEMRPMHFDEKGIVTLTGVATYKKRLLATCVSSIPDIFSKPKFKRMTAYALAYYLALAITQGSSNEAKKIVIQEWFDDDTDIGTLNKAIRENKPKIIGAVPLLSCDPLGIIFLMEKNNIKVIDDKLYYGYGPVMAWKAGDKEAYVGMLAVDGADQPIKIPTPIKGKIK